MSLVFNADYFGQFQSLSIIYILGFSSIVIYEKCDPQVVYIVYLRCLILDLWMICIFEVI